MTGNVFYGRGAFDQRIRFAEDFAADRRTRMRMLMYAAALAPGFIAVYTQFKARHDRTSEKARLANSAPPGTLSDMTSGFSYGEFESISADLQAASDHLDAVFARLGIKPGDVPVIPRSDEDAMAAVAKMQSVQKRLSDFLAAVVT